MPRLRYEVHSLMSDQQFAMHALPQKQYQARKVLLYATLDVALCTSGIKTVSLLALEQYVPKTKNHYLGMSIKHPLSHNVLI